MKISPDLRKRLCKAAFMGGLFSVVVMTMTYLFAFLVAISEVGRAGFFIVGVPASFLVVAASLGSLLVRQLPFFLSLPFFLLWDIFFWAFIFLLIRLFTDSFSRRTRLLVHVVTIAIIDLAGWYLFSQLLDAFARSG